MCKIKSVIEVYFKKLLAKIVNLIFKYILSSYFVKCDWRCSYAPKIPFCLLIENTKKKNKTIDF